MALGGLRRCCRSLLHDYSKGFLCDFRTSSWVKRVIGSKRNLLSEDVVKLQDFQQRKLAAAHHVLTSKGDYFETFRHKLQKNELILKDELKLLLHLCQSVDDVATSIDAIHRYHKENRNLTFEEFKFGPLLMRLCYELGLEEMAASTLTDKSLRGFFRDATSFNIATDMLFTKGCYENALEVIRDMKSQGVPFNKDTYTLSVATCYKLNTPESYRICTALIEEGQVKGHFITRQAYCFAVALALKQNDAGKAKSIYSQIMHTDSRICQNLQVVILATSGEMTEAISVLSIAMLPKSSSFIKKLEFAQEVIDLIRLRCEEGPDMASVEEIVSGLKLTGQVTQQSLDDMLCHTPPGKKKAVAIMEERRFSRRNVRTLQSTLLSE